jgi:hypothetical protein
MSPWVLACGPKANPTSTTSGALGPVLPLLAVIAVSSSPEPPCGLIELILIPYLAVKPSRMAP